MKSQQQPEQETPERTRLQPPLWLACAALAYPVYWSMTLLLRAVPALIRVAFFGHQLAFFEGTFRGARAGAFPAPSASGFTPSLRGTEREPLLITLPLLVALILLLSRMPRQWRPWCGFCLATAGWIGSSGWLGRWAFSSALNASGALALLFFFVVQIIGLYWFVGWQMQSRAWLSMRFALTAWVFPMSALAMLLSQRLFWVPYLWQFCFGVTGATLAVLVRRAASETTASLAWPGWRGVAACTLCSLCMFGLLKAFGASSRVEGAASVRRPSLTKVQ